MKKFYCAAIAINSRPHSLAESNRLKRFFKATKISIPNCHIIKREIIETVGGLKDIIKKGI